MRIPAGVLAFAVIAACAKEKPAADTTKVTAIPSVAPETIKPAPAAAIPQKAPDTVKASSTTKTGTKILGRDSVRIGPIGVLPVDTPKKKPQ